jgi:hypothetical protein
LILHDLPLEKPGERLRAARLQAGFTDISKAAAASGTTVGTLEKHETGRVNFIGRRADPYGKAFRVSPHWLMYGTSDAPFWADPQRRAFSKWMIDTSTNASRVGFAARVRPEAIRRWLNGASPILKSEVRAQIEAVFGTAPFAPRSS